MPAIAAVVAAQSHLPSEVQVALVALAMSPVPPIIQTKQVGAGGRMDYVVGLLVAMGLLAIVLVPLTVAAFNHVFDRSGMIEPVEIAKIIATSVLAPLLAGLVVRRIFPAAEKISGQIIAGAGILLIIVVVIVLYGLWPTIAGFLREPHLARAGRSRARGAGRGACARWSGACRPHRARAGHGNAPPGGSACRGDVRLRRPCRSEVDARHHPAVPDRRDGDLHSVPKVALPARPRCAGLNPAVQSPSTLLIISRSRRTAPTRPLSRSSGPILRWIAP